MKLRYVVYALIFYVIKPNTKRYVISYILVNLRKEFCKRLNGKNQLLVIIEGKIISPEETGAKGI